MGVDGCPENGCLSVRLLSNDTKKELVFLTEKLSETVAQARSCLDEINTSHSTLKTTLVSMNETMVLQNERLKQGVQEFESIKRKIEKQDEKIHLLHDDIVIIKTKAEAAGQKSDEVADRQISKPAQATIATVAGGIAAAIIQVLTK